MRKSYLIGLLTIVAVSVLIFKFLLIFNGVHSDKFDFYPFAIVLLFLGLRLLELTDNIEDFKDVKFPPVIEIVFLLSFFVLLFLPMCHVNLKAYSKKEARKLATYKPLFLENRKLNYDYGKDFDNWYNDRFNLRDPLFSLHNYIAMRFNPIFETDKAIFNQKTNWMFVKSQMNILEQLEEMNLERDIINPIEKFNLFCKQHNIGLYVMLIPLQPQLYAENAEPFYSQSEVDKLNDYIKLIQSKASVKIVYPYDDLKQASKVNYTYFKTEHHWTEYGAFIGYKSLIDVINKDYPNIHPVSPDDYNIETSKYVRAGWARVFQLGCLLTNFFPYLERQRDDILDVDYKYYKHKDEANLQITIANEIGNKRKDFYYPKGVKLKVLQLGTSMNENLMQFTPYTFRNVRYIRINDVKGVPWAEEFKVMKYYKSEILAYKPDIIVLCITPENLMRVKLLFEEAE